MSEFKTRLHSVPSGGFLTDRDKDKKPILVLCLLVITNSIT